MSDLIGAATIGGAFGLVDSLLGFGGSLFGASSAYDASVYAADMQYKINQENIEFQKETNDTNWQRQQYMDDLNYTRFRTWNKVDYDRFLENREYQTMLQNTAHQRQVDDLRAAGLNPILSANSGASAAVPALGTSSPPQAQATQDIAPHADASGYNTAASLKAQVGDQIREGLKDGLFGKMVKNYLEAKNMEMALQKTLNNTALTQATLDNYSFKEKLEKAKFKRDNYYQERKFTHDKDMEYYRGLIHRQNSKYDYDLNSAYRTEQMEETKRHNRVLEIIGGVLAGLKALEGAGNLYFKGKAVKPNAVQIERLIERPAPWSDSGIRVE